MLSTEPLKFHSEVIVSDIDNTLICINKRLEACEEEQNFYDCLHSDKYTHLDKPIYPALEKLKEVQEIYQLPVILLTGRLNTTPTGNNEVVNLVNQFGIKATLIYRNVEEELEDIARWKVNKLKTLSLRPIILFEDTWSVIEAFVHEWENLKVYIVLNCETISGPWKIVAPGGTWR